MGLFDRRREPGGPHPRKEPVLTGPLTAAALAGAFAHCADFKTRTVRIAGDARKELALFWLDGMVRTERVCDYILRPLARDPVLAAASPGESWALLASGALSCLTAEAVTTLDEAVFAMMDGAAILFSAERDKALACAVASEEKRAIGQAEDEPVVKGAKDAFVESLRTNTALIRRRLRTPDLRVAEEVVGRRSRTPVDLLWLDGIANAETAAEALRRLRAMDIDGVLDAGHLEQYLCDTLGTPFPQFLATQRPDRLCANLLAGRLAVLVDGVAVGFVLPGDIALFLAAEQDRTDNWMVSAFLSALRYGALLVTLFLPALYVAAVLFHAEMIPLALAESIIAAKEHVPFGTLFEALLLLLAFEVIQEAGLRLPGNLGQTVSILGGLVVGSAAVEAKILSPAVLIVISVAGVAGYTVPSQDFAGGVRIWRFLLTLAGGCFGLLGVTLAGAVLVGHLASLSCFGVPYLAPLTARADGPLLRVPIPRVKLRPGMLKSENRRNQR